MKGQIGEANIVLNQLNGSVTRCALKRSGREGKEGLVRSYESHTGRVAGLYSSRAAASSLTAAYILPPQPQHS